MAKAASTAVAEIPKNQVAPAELMEDLEEYAGAGVLPGAENRVMPFLAIAQSNSPEVDKKSEKYIQGLEVGDIFDTATHEFWPGDEGVEIVWANAKKHDVEWVPRNEGGGYIATHPWPSNIPVQNIDGRRIVKGKTTQLVETVYQFIILPETGASCVIALTSTNLGVHRLMSSIMDRILVPNKTGKLVKAPSFSRIWNLKTVYKENDKGKWYGFKATDQGFLDTSTQGHVYAAARDFFRITNDPSFSMGRPADTEGGAAPDDGDVPI